MKFFPLHAESGVNSSGISLRPKQKSRKRSNILNDICLFCGQNIDKKANKRIKLRRKAARLAQWSEVQTLQFEIKLKKAFQERNNDEWANQVIFILQLQSQFHLCHNTITH